MARGYIRNLKKTKVNRMRELYVPLFALSPLSYNNKQHGTFLPGSPTFTNTSNIPREGKIVGPP